LGTLNPAQRQAYQKVWSVLGAVNGMLQYYRAMPQLAPSEKVARDEGEQVMTTIQMKIPNIRISCPILILWGEQDQAFIKENLDGIEEYVPDVKVKRFHKASHWLQHELPNEVNQEIHNFLTISKTFNYLKQFEARLSIRYLNNFWKPINKTRIRSRSVQLVAKIDPINPPCLNYIRISCKIGL
jgi:hypothetical protein